MAHKVPDGENCKNYFKYGKSFPENVEDALCEIDFGATGPTGPMGPSGSGVVTNEAYTPDAFDTNVIDLTINGSCTLASPSNFKNGRTISLVLRQGGRGNNTMQFDPMYHFDGGYNALTLSSGAKDVIVATKINDFIFTTVASDLKHSLGDATY